MDSTLHLLPSGSPDGYQTFEYYHSQYDHYDQLQSPVLDEYANGVMYDQHVQVSGLLNRVLIVKLNIYRACMVVTSIHHTDTSLSTPPMSRGSLDQVPAPRLISTRQTQPFH
jgi:hypothetical protein